jgi:hypothetical protein
MHAPQSICPIVIGATRSTGYVIDAGAPPTPD